MSDLEKYLEQQKKINEELDDILKAVNDLDEKEKNMLYTENKKLIEEVKSLRAYNVQKMGDRVSLLHNRLDATITEAQKLKDQSFLDELCAIRGRLCELDVSIGQITQLIEEKEIDLVQDGFCPPIKKPNAPIPLDLGKGLPGIAAAATLNKASNIESKAQANETDEMQRKVSKKSAIKTEFNIGANLLNIIGVILVLISIIIFGKYIYSNLFSNALKGFFLFVLSIAVVASGEYFFKPKLPRYAEGISALGVSSLYASLMINYLILNTLSGLWAIILSVIITGFSIYLSRKNDSNIIRMIALLGGYGCLFPLEYLSGAKSYITVIILTLISVANLVFPIKKANVIFKDYAFDFGKGSIIINMIFMFSFLGSGNLEDYAAYLYLALTLATIAIYYSLMNYDSHKTLFIGSFIILGSTFGTEAVLVNFFVYLLLFSACFWFTRNKPVSNVYLSLGLICLAILLDIFGEKDLWVVAMLTYGVVMMSVFFLKTRGSNYLKITTGLLLFVSGTLTVFCMSDLLTVFALIGFGFILWYLSLDFKEDMSYLGLKYIYLASWMFYISYIFYYTLELENLGFTLSMLFVFIFILLNTHCKNFRTKSSRWENEKLLMIALFLNNARWNQTLMGYMLMAFVTFLFVYMITSKIYVQNPIFDKKKYKIYAESIILESFFLFAFVINHLTLSNILFSISLMIVAFGCVWFGFNKSDAGLRKLGLGLALFVCAKLILYDLSSMEFILKAVLFFIVGIAALVISYYYSKQERDQNKK